MQFFENAYFALVGFIFVFFLVFFYLCYAWSAIYKRKERIIIGMIVSFFVSFRFLATGVFILFLISFLLPSLERFLPTISKIIH